jgi:hypothetical protein
LLQLQADSLATQTEDELMSDPTALLTEETEEELWQRFEQELNVAMEEPLANCLDELYDLLELHAVPKQAGDVVFNQVMRFRQAVAELHLGIWHRLVTQRRMN